MSRLLVGEKGCTFHDVVQILGDSCVVSIVLKEWIKLAWALKCDDVSVDTWQEDIRLQRQGKLEVIGQILRTWRSLEGKNATLGTLLARVENQCKWTQVAELLRDMIKDKAKEWEDLDAQTKTDVLGGFLNCLERKKKLLEIRRILGSQTFDKILQNFLRGDLLKSILNDTTHTLDIIQKEFQIPFYVGRFLTQRHQLDKKIFNEECDDVFVFENIMRYQLSTLVHPNITDLSSNQVHSITVRFILCEGGRDFEILCEKARAPVHRIKYKNGNIFWKNTAGSTKLIQKHLTDTVEKIPENDFITNKLGIFNTKPILIVDCPGMGKTELLSEIARNAAERYPERYILFVSLPKILTSLEERTEELISLDLIKSTLAKCSSSSLLDREIIYQLMSYENAKFDIFLDAYDKTTHLQIPLSEKMLEIFSHSKNLRVIVASRSYMRHDLERKFGIISLGIQQFTTIDQVKLFKLYWKDELIYDNFERVQDFVGDFVKHLNSNDIVCNVDEDNDFAGIALQCCMLADVHKNDAQRYVSSKKTKFEITHNIRTLDEMYNKFMDFKFENKNCMEKAAVKQAYWIVATDVIFPEWKDELRDIINSKIACTSDTNNMLLSVGLLSSIKPDKFIHRSFAQYLVADFIVSTLTSKDPKKIGVKFLKFLFKGALASTRTAQRDEIAGRTFQHSTVAHFVNSLLYRKNPDFDKVSRKLRPDLMLLHSDASESQILSWFFENVAKCNKRGYTNLLSFFIAISSDLVNIPNLKNSDWKGLALTATQHDVSFFQTLTQYIESLYGNDLLHMFIDTPANLAYALTPLHQATLHGNYEVVEYLISKYGKDIISKSEQLIYHCISETSRESPNVISQKIDILRFLDEVGDENIFEEITSKIKQENTAHPAFGIHIDLFRCLMEIENQR